MTAARAAADLAALLPMNDPLARLGRLRLDAAMRREQETTMTTIGPNGPEPVIDSRTIRTPRSGEKSVDGVLYTDTGVKRPDGVRVAGGPGSAVIEPTDDGGSWIPTEQAEAERRVGTPLRDAAVDPRPDELLPPIGAGEFDPHGPNVVAIEVGDPRRTAAVAAYRAAQAAAAQGDGK